MSKPKIKISHSYCRLYLVKAVRHNIIVCIMWNPKSFFPPKEFLFDLELYRTLPLLYLLIIYKAKIFKMW